MLLMTLKTLACMAVSFLVCGIPFGLIIARGSSEHVDVRTVGSGNIGMTNVARSAGAGAAALTFACDVLKGTACVVVSRLVLGWDATAPAAAYGWCAGLVFMASVLGHVFSPYLRFKGGKGISTGFGAALGVSPLFALSMIAVFFVLALPTRYVSLGSVAAALSLPVFSLVYGFSLLTVLPMLVVSAVVVWKHRENLRKLRDGTERKFSVHRKERHQ